MARMDVRDAIVRWARWGVANKARFIYTEAACRMADEHRPVPSSGPITCDCSAFFTYCYCWANAPDPNGLNYDGAGYTGTLLAHGRVIGPLEAMPGDAIVYGPGSGWHVAMIVDVTPNPLGFLTVSHGQQGDPSLVRVAQDGRQPQRILRFDTTAPVPPPRPSSPAARLGAGARPPGPIPTLTPGGLFNDRRWVRYGNRLLNIALGEHVPVVGGGFGRLRQGQVVRGKEHFGIPKTHTRLDRTFTPELFMRCGVTE